MSVFSGLSMLTMELRNKPELLIMPQIRLNILFAIIAAFVFNFGAISNSLAKSARCRCAMRVRLYFAKICHRISCMNANLSWSGMRQTGSANSFSTGHVAMGIVEPVVCILDITDLVDLPRVTLRQLAQAATMS